MFLVQFVPFFGSRSYALLALFIYIWGILYSNKTKCIISYLLFTFVGIKVYFSDLSNVGQVYKSISLLGFGGVLLLASFLESKIMRLKQLSNVNNKEVHEC